jgi:hypothetical protein
MGSLCPGHLTGPGPPVDGLLSQLYNGFVTRTVIQLCYPEHRLRDWLLRTIKDGSEWTLRDGSQMLNADMAE